MNTLRMKLAMRITMFFVMAVSLLSPQTAGVSTVKAGSAQQAAANFAIVFVSRKIPANGSVYMGPSETGSLPGVGPYARLQVAAPGKLMVREANGALRTLVNGANPTAVSLNLIDVNAPDVSYNGTKIVFAGLVAGSYSTAPLTNPGAWRIYTINVDGTGLQQVTFSDRDNLDLSQFRDVADLFKEYDDTDPAWLPDGRIVFSSTRWPAFGQYGGVRASNLYVVNADGTNLHRITSERSGADRPQVDPITGKIVYSRWWRNLRIATNSMDTIPNPAGGYDMKDGLLSIVKADMLPEVGGFKNMERNTWHLAAINPDGTHLAQWGGRSSSYFYGQIANHAYGGGFAPDGSFYANFFPMNNMTEAAGFGGIRLYQRGPNGYKPIIGVTVRNDSTQPLVKYSPPSHGIYQSDYAAEPEVLPDGRLVISLAKDIAQDYGLYIINSDGSGLTSLYDNAGTTELRARVIRSRSLPPVIPDRITQVASLLPPLAEGPYDKDGTFTFQALNVYFNAPVDTDILNAMPVGSANTIRFFIDHQRWQQSGSHENFDWPILLKEIPVNPDGSLTTSSPANVPLFEQIRSAQPGYTVPLTGKASLPEEMGGAAHVAGMNFGRPGDVVQCVGCHAGHSMIPVPANPEDAKWTNLAPGAAITVSSLDTSLPNSNGLTDRRVKMAFPANKYQKYWISKAGLNANAQWVQLTFPVPITIRSVRLYNIPSADSSIRVQAATVKLFNDAAGTALVGSNTSGALAETGTDVSFNDLSARVVRVEINSVSGSAAALAEVEVIARAGDGATNPPTITVTPTAPISTLTATSTSTPPTVSVTPATPTSTATSVVTTTPLPTITAIPSDTSVPASPTANSNAILIAPESLVTQRGTTAGSLSSLGTLKLSGTEDNPDEYVAFNPKGTKYTGYLSFHVPVDTQPSSISVASLRVNFKGTSTSKQTWAWSIFDWNVQQWVRVGSVSVKGQNKWQMLNFDISLLPQYASPEKEVRIELKSNNASSAALIDYEVLQLSTSP